ncbi:hypothetical protein [Cupriavidus pauculus]|uniref:hypothetical protein n=1 Tax=Cupriavidus pauculus TaxID=82633 RepID=UPI00078367DA|nr:hypothetical protein [Cupriavidus pauculus]
MAFTGKRAFIRGNQPSVVADAIAMRTTRTGMVHVKANELQEGALMRTADLCRRGALENSMQ